jgi:hypothetical protein
MSSALSSAFGTHNPAAVTKRYIGIEAQRIEAAIEGHAKLL